MAMVCVASAWPRVRSGCEGDAGHRRAAATQPLAKLRRPERACARRAWASSGGACDGTASRRAALLAQALLAQAQTLAITRTGSYRLTSQPDRRLFAGGPQ